MYYVYLIESIPDPNRHYVGFTEDLRQRLTDHNAGKNTSTASHRPWRLVTYLAFSSKKQALALCAGLPDIILSTIKGAISTTTVGV